MRPDSAPMRLARQWPWVLLALLVAPALWHAVDFPEDRDEEFPAVVRPTFSAHPPPAYRLAEPGDTIDRIALYVTAVAGVVALGGLLRSPGRRGPWSAALAVTGLAFWTAANPGPTFDGWHGLGWGSFTHPRTPPIQKAALAAALCALLALTAAGLGRPSGWKGFLGAARRRGVLGLLVAAALLACGRFLGLPDPEPRGYWPRWLFVWALALFAAALLRLLPPAPRGVRPWRRLAWAGVGGALWLGVVAAGVGLTWYHRPLQRLRAVVPGRIYVSAMPTGRGLELAQARHHFKTIINLFPEDTRFRSPRLPEELRFAARHGVRYIGSPPDTSASNDFLDLTLKVAQDPAAWPVLIHCHACMDRTPAWVGIYQFVVEGKPLADALRFIERHRGYRPKASVTLLYNRVLPRLAPERYRADPTAALLRACAAGTVDPYYGQLEAERRGANQGETGGVGPDAGAASAALSPSLTPRR